MYKTVFRPIPFLIFNFVCIICAICDLIGVAILAVLMAEFIDIPLSKLSLVQIETHHFLALILFRFLCVSVANYALNLFSLNNYNKLIMHNMSLDLRSLFECFENNSEIDTKYGVSRWGYINTFLVPSNNLFVEIYAVSLLVMYLILTIGYQIIIVIILFVLLISGIIYSSKRASIRISNLRLELEQKNTDNVQNMYNFRYYLQDRYVRKFFEEKLSATLRTTARVISAEHFLSNVPRYFLEAVVTLALLVSITINISDISNENLLILGVGALRLLPSAVRIGAAIQTINFSRKFRELFQGSFQKHSTNSLIIMEQNKKCVLKLEKFKYFGREHTFDVSIPKGSIMLIDGSSGAGKSYLMNELIRGLVQNHAEDLGFMFQDTALLPGSLIENILMGRNIDPLQLNTIIKNTGLNAQFTEKELHRQRNFNVKSDQISGGQKKRLGLARAVVNNPKYIFLDEPTAGLDHQSAKLICDYIKKITCTAIFLISHDDMMKNTSNIKILLDQKDKTLEIN